VTDRLREITAEQAQREKEQALADASALDRLAAYPEWAVLDRLMGEHAERVAAALRQRGLDLATTEALRAELDTVDWLRYRPIALRRALDSQQDYEHAAQGRVRSE
jgi:hypothetical protein